MLNCADRHGRRVGRYAPSPSGPLHLGNVRTALVAWLQCRLDNGIFILRMEDLDRPRTKAGAAESIIDDLRWLGLDWDEGPDVGGAHGSYVQSERDSIYEAALSQLISTGRVFRCQCSRKDIERAASAPHEHESQIYPGTCRVTGHVSAPPDSNDDQFPDTAFRLRVDDDVIQFADKMAGKQTMSMKSQCGDFVIRRRDGLFAYQLAVAVDDALMGVTDVVRGLDLLDSTPRQLLILKVLDLPTPTYWHVPLMLDDEGRRLAKRDGAASLDEYRQNGFDASDVVGLLAQSLGLTKDRRRMLPKDLLDHLGEGSSLERGQVFGFND